MSRPPKKGGISRPKSPIEDHKLWKEWAKSITPFGSSKGRVRLGVDERDKPTDLEASPDNQPQTPGSKTSANTKHHPKSHPLPAPNIHKTRSTIPHRIPQLADFDNKSRRKLRSGQIEIAARIDLHGMHQHEAYAALHGFLSTSQARGLRWVLVITGKGAPSVDREQAYDDHWMGGHGQGRGVLRRMVPQWLSETEFRTIVVSHTTAAPHHGGEGARYIQLRSKRRN